MSGSTHDKLFEILYIFLMSGTFLTKDPITPFGHRSSVIGHRSSVIGHRSSVIGHRSSVIGTSPQLYLYLA